jgi:hypothetical protein
MFRLYLAQAIDCSADQGKQKIRLFKELFESHPEIALYGAGIGESPIIKLDTPKILKKAIVAYDLRKIRECDVFLMVTDLKTYCAGTHMELEYARNLGMLTIILCLTKDPIKNIFLETMADKIIYTLDDLERLLWELSQ